MRARVERQAGPDAADVRPQAWIAIAPGAIETDIMKVAGRQAAEAMGITYEEFLGGYAEEASIKRLNTLEEVAAMAVLLCSTAGGGINGAVLDVHGGTLLA